MSIKNAASNWAKEYRNNEFYPIQNTASKIADLQDTHHGVKARLLTFKLHGLNVLHIIGSIGLKLPVQIVLLGAGMVLKPAIGLMHRIVTIKRLDKNNPHNRKSTGPVTRRYLDKVLPKIDKALSSGSLIGTIVKVVKLSISVLLFPVGLIAPQGLFKVMHSFKLISNAKLAAKDREKKILREQKKLEGASLKIATKAIFARKLQAKTEKAIKQEIFGKLTFDDAKLEFDGEEKDVKVPIISSESKLGKKLQKALDDKRKRSEKALLAKKGRELNQDEIDERKTLYYSPKPPFMKPLFYSIEETVNLVMKFQKDLKEFFKWNLDENDVSKVIRAFSYKYRTNGSKYKAHQKTAKTAVKVDADNAVKIIVKKELEAKAIDKAIRENLPVELLTEKDIEEAADNRKSLILPHKHYVGLFQMVMRELKANEKIDSDTKIAKRLLDIKPVEVKRQESFSAIINSLVSLKETGENSIDQKAYVGFSLKKIKTGIINRKRFKKFSFGQIDTLETKEKYKAIKKTETEEARVRTLLLDYHSRWSNTEVVFGASSKVRFNALGLPKFTDAKSKNTTVLFKGTKLEKDAKGNYVEDDEKDNESPEIEEAINQDNLVIEAAEPVALEAEKIEALIERQPIDEPVIEEPVVVNPIPVVIKRKKKKPENPLLSLKYKTSEFTKEITFAELEKEAKTRLNWIKTAAKEAKKRKSRTAATYLADGGIYDQEYYKQTQTIRRNLHKEKLFESLNQTIEANL